MQQRRRMLPFAFPFIVSTLALALLPYVQIMPNRFNCPIIPLGGAQNGGVTRGGRTHADADNEFSVRDATPTSFFSLRRHQLAQSRPSASTFAARPRYCGRSIALLKWQTVGCQTSHVDLVRQGEWWGIFHRVSI